jgi:hypothetical protein
MPTSKVNLQILFCLCKTHNACNKNIIQKQHLTRTLNMRKTLISLTIALAAVSGSAMADQATLSALQTASITMTTAQTEAILAAQGDQIAAAIGELIAANPAQAVAIVTAAIKAHPELAVAIVRAAILAAPAQASAITDAAIAAAPNQKAAIIAAANQAIIDAGSAVNGDVSVPTNSIPSSTVGGGSSVASPN